jgi:hypothetical protein
MFGIIVFGSHMQQEESRGRKHRGEATSQHDSEDPLIAFLVLLV